MHLRELVKQRWSDARLYSQADPHLSEFLAYFEANPGDCWEAAVAVFREKYYRLYDQIVPPLVNSTDKALRIQIIRHTDPSRPKEMRTLKEIVRSADPVADRPELNAILAMKRPALHKEIAGRPELAPVLAPAAEIPPRPVTNVLRPAAAAHPRAVKKRARKKKGSP